MKNLYYYTMLVVLISQFGCVPPKLMNSFPSVKQAQLPSPAEPATTSWVKLQSNAELIVVELDNEGEFYGSEQRGFALERVKYLANNKQALRVVFFIHGWDHNAFQLDPNRQHFQNLICSMAAAPDSTDPYWIGVYIGWRGKVVNSSLLSWATFYDRKAAAVRAGGLPLSLFLGQMGEAVHASVGKDHIAVAVGHSFGARVLERAYLPSLAVPNSKPLLDLVFLLNPATEALQAKIAMDVLNLRLQAGETFASPLLVCIASDSDQDTGKLFPSATWIPALFHNFQDDDEYKKNNNTEIKIKQGELWRFTAPYSDTIITHDVKSLSEVNDWSRLPKSDVIPLWFNNENQNSNLPPEKILIARTPATGNKPYLLDSPYWIFKVPSEFSFDHSDIFRPPLIHLITTIIRRQLNNRQYNSVHKATQGSSFANPSN